MTQNLFNQLRSFISSPLISKLSKRYEENEGLLKKALETSICTILIGLYNKMEDTTLYDKIIESIATSKFYETIEFENGKHISINNSFDEEGQSPLNLIFSNKKGRISETISNELGVKSETAVAIFNLSVMFVLSYFKNQNQNAKELHLILEEQKKGIINAIPEGIRIILGFSNFECIEDYSIASDSNDKPNFISSIYNLFMNSIQSKPLSF